MYYDLTCGSGKATYKIPSLNIPILICFISEKAPAFTDTVKMEYSIACTNEKDVTMDTV